MRSDTLDVQTGRPYNIFESTLTIKRRSISPCVYPSLRRRLVINKHVLASWSFALMCRLNLQLPWIVRPNSEIMEWNGSINFLSYIYFCHSLVILFVISSFFSQSPIPDPWSPYPRFPVNRQTAIFRHMLENFCRFVCFWVSEEGHVSIRNNNKAMPSNVYLSFPIDHLHCSRPCFPFLLVHLEAPS